MCLECRSVEKNRPIEAISIFYAQYYSKTILRRFWCLFKPLLFIGQGEYQAEGPIDTDSNTWKKLILKKLINELNFLKIFNLNK